MSEQSLRAALEKVLATTDGWAVSNETLLGLLAAHPAEPAVDDLAARLRASVDTAKACRLGHPAEPAPVVTDEAVEAAAMAVSLDWENYTASMRTALEAAAPLLGPRPLLDREAVCEKIADWYSAHYNPDHDFFYETDDHGVKGDEDENATHAYRGFKLALDLARPMPTRWQIEAALGRGIRFGGNEDEHGKAVDAVLALLTGAGS